MSTKLFTRNNITEFCSDQRAGGKTLVFTNGCFDLLHVGHVDLLERAKALGDVLIVGLNSDESVRRLKGDSRPINNVQARAKVLLALRAVDAVVVFEEDTPIEILEIVRPNIHVKGGDYVADNLPEAETVRRYGGGIAILPLVEGFSSTGLLAKRTSAAEQSQCSLKSTLVIPARYDSTRFPGKPLAILNGEAVIVHTVRAGLKTQIQRPLLVATDNEKIASVIKSTFEGKDVLVVMTDSDCKTGTERVAQAVQRHFGDTNLSELLILNVQGDEPFINSGHLDALLLAMLAEPDCLMGTLAAPLNAEAVGDSNAVKVVTSLQNKALYFSRHGIPYQREQNTKSTFERLRHVGVYAYRGDWLLKMATLSPTPLEEMEMLEQLRALENGIAIHVVRVDEVVPIAIDTPHDLERAQQYLNEHRL
ncbi:MAG: D-glycero-beta-D-manno-heptose 1-phosphate adenylyltransferase [Abditibacteriaceae bacterium]